MGPHQHVDAVDLVQVQPRQRAGERPARHAGFGTGPAEALRGQRDPARLAGRKLSMRAPIWCRTSGRPASPSPGTI